MIVFEGMQKSVMSSFASTDAGSSVIIKVLGEESANVVKTLFEVVTAHKDAEFSRNMRDILFKVVLKIRFMFEHEKIKPIDSMHMHDPVNNIALYLYTMFDQRVAADDKLNEPISVSPSHQSQGSLNSFRNAYLKRHQPVVYKIEAVNSNICRFADMVLDLIHDHMTEKNLVLTKSFFDYFGSLSFLEFLFMNPVNRTVRQSLHQSLRILLARLLLQREVRETLEAAAPCKVSACPENKLVRKGDFRGSELCMRHHIDEKAPMLREPSLKLFFDVLFS